MKDKRLELKLSVRGDGSLTRNSLRSSNRSNRSNGSNNSAGLPVSEIFATDRYAAPYSRPYFDILDKYRRPPNPQGYPAQSLQNLNQYEQPIRNGYDRRERRNPYIDYTSEPSRNYNYQHIPEYTQLQYSPTFGPPRYQAPPLNPSNQIYGTLPRRGPQHENLSTSGHYTLPTRSGVRRVRISELKPIVHGYGMLEQCNCQCSSFIFFKLILHCY